MWRDDTQVNYFGIGSDAFDSEQSHYRMKATQPTSATHQSRPTDCAHIRRHAGLAAAISRSWRPGERSGKRDLPDTRELFPARSGCRPRRSQPDFLHGGLSATAFDTRDYPDHPTKWRPVSGGTDGLFRPDDRNLQFPVNTRRRPRSWCRLRTGAGSWRFEDGRYVTAMVADGRDIPFYLLPSLGGHNTLRDYHNFQFHDRQCAPGQCRVAMGGVHARRRARCFSTPATWLPR